MTPEMVLLTIQEVAKALTEVSRLAQTPAGQATIIKALEDRAAWDSFWERTGKALRGFLNLPDLPTS